MHQRKGMPSRSTTTWTNPDAADSDGDIGETRQWDVFFLANVPVWGRSRSICSSCRRWCPCSPARLTPSRWSPSRTFMWSSAAGVTALSPASLGRPGKCRKRGLPEGGPTGTPKTRTSYLVLRRLDLKGRFAPVIFIVPIEVVISPTSFDSSILPAKVISNFRSPKVRTILKST